MDADDGEALCPPAFLCPITLDVFVEPVVTSDGHSYSRAAIELCFQTRHTSPLTNEELASTQLLPNHRLRQAIEEWRKQQPMAIDPDRLEVSEELLGEGSFGRVLAGTLRIGRRVLPVAVKMLPAMTRLEERQALEKELKAHMHAARHCDGVCVLLGTSELGPRLCIIMKRYERSLKSAIVLAGNAAAGKLEPAVVIRYAYSLFRTLRQLHECGMVVRDIKPDNILLDAFGELVLADFGISHVLQTVTHVQQSNMNGTFNYMAPEAFSEGAVGRPVDIWAMACVVVEMHSGQMPWAGMRMEQIITAVRIDKRAPAVPERAPAAELLRRCFATAAADRPSAAEMMEPFAPAPAASQLEQRCEELQSENHRLEHELKEQQEITQQMITAQLRLEQRIAESKTAAEQREQQLRSTFDAEKQQLRSTFDMEKEVLQQRVRSLEEQLATPAFDSMFDITALTRKLAQPQGAHDVLAEACALAQQLTGASVEQVQQLQYLQQLQHCLGRHLPILKTPPADMRKTLVQLASQEPAGSRLLQQAQAALHSLQHEVIEWVNKPRAPLPCVMEIREHSGAVFAVAVSPDGKWMASGSEDTTVKVVEIATGRVKCTLTGHSRR